MIHILLVQRYSLFSPILLEFYVQPIINYFPLVLNLFKFFNVNSGFDFSSCDGVKVDF